MKVKKMRFNIINVIIVFIFIAGLILFFTVQADRKVHAANVVIDGITDPTELDDFQIDNQGYTRDRKSPVKFPHKQHVRKFDVSCWDCHHDYTEKKENIWSPWGKTQKWSECHDPLEDQGKAIRLQTAYHRNCKTCHEERDIFAGEPRAYRKCVKCHVKKL